MLWYGNNELNAMLSYVTYINLQNYVMALVAGHPVRQVQNSMSPSEVQGLVPGFTRRLARPTLPYRRPT